MITQRRREPLKMNEQRRGSCNHMPGSSHSCRTIKHGAPSNNYFVRYCRGVSNLLSVNSPRASVLYPSGWTPISLETGASLRESYDTTLIQSDLCWVPNAKPTVDQPRLLFQGLKLEYGLNSLPTRLPKRKEQPYCLLRCLVTRVRNRNGRGPRKRAKPLG